MADVFSDRMDGVTRSVFLFRAVINLSLGAWSFWITDVPPTQVWGVVFVVAGVMNLVVACQLRATRLVSWALVLSFIACMARCAGLVVARVQGRKVLDIPHFAFGITTWVGLAGSGVVMTLAFAKHLGRRDRGK